MHLRPLRVNFWFLRLIFDEVAEDGDGMKVVEKCHVLILYGFHVCEMFFGSGTVLPNSSFLVVVVAATRLACSVGTDCIPIE